MQTRVNLGENSYDIIIEKGCLSKAGELLDLNRKVFILTDDGVPAEYAKTVASCAKEAHIYTIPQGEDSKSLRVFGELLSEMLKLGFTRKDCVVAVGGGVVGDLAGFTAASYMRGIDFYNIPTTLLSQVDSSIGGKTAVNLDGIKNIVGAFYQPKRVLIDPITLNTLSPRMRASGLAEAIKMSLTSNAALFEKFENDDIDANLEEIIFESIEIKRKVVEEDEKESGLRKILNFGHTLGHGIESEMESKGMYHGECVALGMLPMCSEAVRARLVKIMNKLELATTVACDREKAISALSHDKKASSKGITIVKVNEPGSFEMSTATVDELAALIDSIIR